MTKNYHNSYLQSLVYLVFFIFSILFLLVFSSSTSPLFNTYGGDSAIFILGGKLFSEGKIPYLDFFDHKGPILILLETIGISLSSDDRTGIFILQVVNLTFTQIFIYKIARLFLSTVNSLAIVLLSLLLFSFTIQGGNLTEEFSLPFNLWALYIVVSLSKDNKSYLKTSQILLLGIFAAILFWIRPNNMGIICGCFCYLVYFYYKRNKFREIKNLLIYFSIGFFSVTLLTIIYFIKINALEDMIYASLEFNLRYITYDHPSPFTDIKSSILHIIKSWTALIVLVIGTIIYYQKTSNTNVIFLTLFLLLFAIVTTQTGQNYYHYMTSNIPCFVLGTIFILKSTPKAKSYIIVSLSFILLCGYTFFKYNDKEYQTSKNDNDFREASFDIISQIPQNEKNLIYTYNIPAKFWLVTNQLPSYKYYAHQDWHSTHDMKISKEINHELSDRQPLWIILPISDKDKELLNVPFRHYLDKNYKTSRENEYFSLYQKR
ncbi:MAG: glycosyltransferase family 39 protein [Dysgonomonas sp.]|nr:glycosyltransferase family 39 protein [Dysgonomonas sp.]